LNFADPEVELHRPRSWWAKMSNSSGVFAKVFSPNVRLQTWSFWPPNLQFSTLICEEVYFGIVHPQFGIQNKKTPLLKQKKPLRDGLEHWITQPLAITPVSRVISPQLAFHFRPFLRAMYLHPIYNLCLGVAHLLSTIFDIGAKLLVRLGPSQWPSIGHHFWCLTSRGETPSEAGRFRTEKKKVTSRNAKKGDDE